MKIDVLFILLIIVVLVFWFGGARLLIDNPLMPSPVRDFSRGVFDTLEFSSKAINKTFDTVLGLTRFVTTSIDTGAEKIGENIPLLQPIPETDPKKSEKYEGRGFTLIGLVLFAVGITLGALTPPVAAATAALVSDTTLIAAAGGSIVGYQAIKGGVLPSITPSSPPRLPKNTPKPVLGADDNEVSVYGNTVITLGEKRHTYITFAYEKFMAWLLGDNNVRNVTLEFPTSITFNNVRITNMTEKIIQFEYESFENLEQTRPIITLFNDKVKTRVYKQNINPSETYEFVYSRDNGMGLFVWKWYKI